MDTTKQPLKMTPRFSQSTDDFAKVSPFSPLRGVQFDLLRLSRSKDSRPALLSSHHHRLQMRSQAAVFFGVSSDEAVGLRNETKSHINSLHEWYVSAQ